MGSNPSRGTQQKGAYMIKKIISYLMSLLETKKQKRKKLRAKVTKAIELSLFQRQKKPVVLILSENIEISKNHNEFSDIQILNYVDEDSVLKEE